MESKKSSKVSKSRTKVANKMAGSKVDASKIAKSDALCEPAASAIKSTGSGYYATLMKQTKIKSVSQYGMPPSWEKPPHVPHEDLHYLQICFGTITYPLTCYGTYSTLQNCRNKNILKNLNRFVCTDFFVSFHLELKFSICLADARQKSV